MSDVSETYLQRIYTFWRMPDDKYMNVGRWFLQIVDMDSRNLYTIYLFPLFPCYDFLSQMCGWFFYWGGVMFFLHFMLFPPFLKTNNSGNKLFLEKQISFI